MNENNEPKIIMVGGEEALDLRGTPEGEEIEAIMREEHGPSAADLGAEIPGVDDETFERGGIEMSATPEPLNNMMRFEGKKLFGRNSKCPCGSGKKFKKCCWGKLDGYSV